MTTAQERGLVALLASKTVVEAAEKAGVNERTMLRWLQIPEFKSEYNAARREVIGSAITALQSASAEAVDALVRNLRSGKPAVEISAARTILEHAIGAVDGQELEERIIALEASLQSLRPSGKAKLHAVR